MSWSEIEQWLPKEISNTLTRAEKTLFQAIEQGKEINFSTGDKVADALNNDNSWDDSRTLRSIVLRWLVTNKKIEKLLIQKGIRIIGAKVIDVLDLEALTLPFPLVFVSCTLREGINLKSVLQ